MILSGEKKVIDYLIKNKYGLLFIAVNLVAVFIRISGYHFVSGDMNVYLINWYNQIDNLGGANALKNQVGDYNILYQELIALAVFFRIPALMTFKMLSIFFDFLLSVVVGLVASSFNVKNKFRNFLFGYSFSILSPLVVLNSSFWGQADSIYAFFVLFSIFLIIKDKFMLSFIMLGLALAFKLQTVFILPFFFLIYALKKNFSILYFVFLPLMLYVVAIPSFFFGRDLLSPLTIYANQTEGYPLLTLNMPNIWTFFWWKSV
ncbi:hypothetical protein [uncultured Fructobacillus sp.]|uniref:hypothetical protein n=1 Tax=uncultured Fructobacillus sp. TaxID=591942 RepID=UPI002592D30B|nr:hypothetical protein [uncultured Fructobacillus sp.]